MTPEDATLILDHVVGDPSVPAAAVHALLAELPFPSHPTPRLRRAILLRRLDADPVSASSLDTLQLLASLPASGSGSPIAATHIAVAASAPDFDAAARALFARPNGRARRAIDEGGSPALASDEAIATADQFEANVGNSFAQTVLRALWGKRDNAEKLVRELLAAEWAAIGPSLLVEAAERLVGDGAVETWGAADEATRVKLRNLVGEENSRKILSKLEGPHSLMDWNPTGNSTALSGALLCYWAGLYANVEKEMLINGVNTMLKVAAELLLPKNPEDAVKCLKQGEED